MPRAVLRFLALALPAAVAVLFAVDAGAAALGVGPDLDPLAVHAVARVEPLSPALRAAIAGFEAVALLALYLLVEGRSGSPLVDGVAAGVAAWLFRGPLLVASVAALTRLPVQPFWQAARVALVALPAAGLAIGLVAELQRPGRAGPPAP